MGEQVWNGVRQQGVIYSRPITRRQVIAFGVTKNKKERGTRFGFSSPCFPAHATVQIRAWVHVRVRVRIVNSSHNNLLGLHIYECEYAGTNPYYSSSLRRWSIQLGNCHISYSPASSYICVCCRTRRCFSGTRLRLNARVCELCSQHRLKAYNLRKEIAIAQITIS